MKNLQQWLSRTFSSEQTWKKWVWFHWSFQQLDPQPARVLCINFKRLHHDSNMFLRQVVSTKLTDRSIQPRAGNLFTFQRTWVDGHRVVIHILCLAKQRSQLTYTEQKCSRNLQVWCSSKQRSAATSPESISVTGGLGTDTLWGTFALERSNK